MEKNTVYKCEICGNIVELTHVGGGELVCCGQPMVKQEENTVDAAKEKHVPIVEKTEAGVKVTVGEVVHPMEGSHYIEWIEVIAGEQIFRKYLKPGDAPVAEFSVTGKLTARAYCNLHGLWKSS